MKSLKCRILKDKLARSYMLAITLLSILLLFFMGGGLFNNSLPLLKLHSLKDLLSSSNWNPFKNEFGFFPFIYSTLLVTLLSIVLAFPVSLLTALLISEKASSHFKKIISPVLDILAGIPSVIYGVWGVLIIVPWISKYLAPKFSISSSGYSLLASGIVLAVMIIPILISLLTQIFTNVPEDLKEASTSLGATQWQTIKNVVIKKSLSGIIASVVLGISKSFGETIAVVMVCGNSIQIPHSIFESGYPLPALIANNYGEMMSIPNYESALMFAAFLLFFMILIFNLISRIILHRLQTKF